jgi:hypothetical protein
MLDSNVRKGADLCTFSAIWNGRCLRIAAVHRAVFERPRAQARD